MKQTYRKWPDGSLVNWRFYKKANKKLANILAKEIRDEINREVVAAIMAETNNKKGA